MRIAVAVFALGIVLSSGLAGAGACGARLEEPCRVADGMYRIALPDGVKHPPALLWLHGWGGSADGVIGNRGMVRRLADRGYALIAPDGLVTSPGRNDNKNWAVRDGQSYPRDDVAFLRQVVEDAAMRDGIDRDRILLGGFSRGASMVWDVACLAPGLARAYAPVAGAFWEPMPEDCKAPVDLLHVHGWSDRTVPLEGRPLRNGALIQGDVFESLKILRETNGCGNRQPESAPARAGIWERHWTDCAGGRIDLILHPGSHSVPGDWLDRALDWFEARLAEDCVAEGERKEAASAC